MISICGNTQTETHNFVTYDTTVDLANGGGKWNMKVTRPANMFTAGNPDTASRPAIIFMVGSGEISDPSKLATYGPHYWLANGWDGSVTLTNGTHYPIIISIQPYTTGPTTRMSGEVLLHILRTYHIKANSVHLTGLSMGAMRWEMILNAEQSPGDETYMKKITSIVALSGQGDAYGDSVRGGGWIYGVDPYRDISLGDYWRGNKVWIKKYGGKYFTLEGVSDLTQSYFQFGTNAMNDTLAGVVYDGYYNGGHCCWNTMYDPSNHNWTSVGSPLGSFMVASGSTGLTPRMGTYHLGSNIFEYMIRQGDTSLVGTGGGNSPPTADAGADQAITLPTSTVTLSGSGTDGDGTIVSYAWSWVSGTQGSITSAASASTTVTGLTSPGVRVLRLTVTDNLGATGYDDIQITVNAASGGSSGETHNFITYDTTVIFAGYGAWNVKISRPANMFVAGDPDTASRPAIIFMVGVSEVGQGNFAGLTYNGPHALYNPTGGGWDGRLVLANGTHYPIYISVSPWQAWPSTRSCGLLLEHLLNTYHIKRNSVHITGLSMGAMSWSRMMNAERTEGDRTWMKLVKSMTLLQGQGNAYYDYIDSNYYMLGGDTPVKDLWAGYGLWAHQYGGKYFGLEGTNDYRDMGWIPKAMQDSAAGSAYRAFEDFNGGTHCCWNSMYDPNATDWTSIGILGPNITTGYYSPNYMGTYVKGESIFAWMLKQGDTSLVGTGNQAPIADAGPDKVITLPTATATLNGSGVDGDGTISGYAWTQVSGTAATISSPSSATTNITGLSTTGIRTFRLTVTDNLGSTGTDDVLVTVNGVSPPTSLPGSNQTIQLPTSTVSLAGSGIAGGGGPITTFAWSQVSGTTAIITSPSNASTTITDLSTAGTRVFRLTVTDSIGSSATGDVTIYVLGLTGNGNTVNVNLYANNDPYNNSQWNNQLITQSNYPYTSGVYNFDYGAASTIYTTISASQTPSSSTYGDNGAGYPTTMCPSEVGRYTSFWPGSRTITFKGLDNAKLYDIKLYESRSNPNHGATRNTVNGTSVDIVVYQNYTNIATFSNIVPTSNQIVVTQSYGTGADYVYLNGFTIVEKSTSNQLPTANAGADQSITLPTSTVNLSGSGSDPDGSIQAYTWVQVSGTAASISNPNIATPVITGLTTAGTRVFRLTVTDNSGGTASDDVSIFVNPLPTNTSTFVSVTNTPQTVTTTTATLTAIDSAAAGIASIKWTKFLAPSQTVKSLTVIGSSTAYGNGTDNVDSQFVRRIYNYYTANGVMGTLTNLSNPGTSPMDANITAALNTGCDVLLVSYPSNGYTATSNAVMLAKLQSFKDSCDARGKQFYITGTQPRNDYSPADRANLVVFNDSLRNRFGTRFIDVLTPLLNTTDNTIKAIYYADGIHPNNAGHRIIYDKVRAANIFKDYAISNAAITTSTNDTTTVTSLTNGTHIFQIAMIDNGGYAYTSLGTFNVSISNQPPTANAGNNQTITLPMANTTLVGTGTDVDGTITAYAWTQVSGAVATITSPAAATTTITNLSSVGDYVFRLMVTDDGNLTGSSDVKITVLPAIITGSTTTILGPNSNLGTSGSPRTNFNPGDTILLRDSSSYFSSPMYLQLRGTPAKPIVIMNSAAEGRAVRIRSTTGTIYLKNSQYVKITGSGLSGTQYGIEIDHSLGNSPDTFSHGGGSDGISIDGRSKNIEVEYVSIHNVGTGIKISQTAGCVDSLRYIDTMTVNNALYPNFVQDSIVIHDNKIVGTQYEGIYVGYEDADNSSARETNPLLQTLVNRPVICSGDTTYPEPLRTGYIHIYKNYGDSTGKNGIQIGAHDNISPVEINDNVIKHTGMNGITSSGYGIQVRTYAAPYIHDNTIINTLSEGIGLLGSGRTNQITRVQSNYIDSSGYLNYYVYGYVSNTHTLQNPSGVANTIVDHRTSLVIASRPVKYFRGGCDSITYVVTNNRLGINKSRTDAFYNGVSQLTKYFADVQDFWQLFAQAGGSKISCNIGLDGSNTYRTLHGSSFDTLVTVAVSYPATYLNNPWRNPALAPVFDTVCATSTAPTANAGNSKDIVLPVSSTILTGSGTANNGGSITGYAWTQLSGTAATIVSPSSPSTQITGLTTVGTRVFQLTVTQNDNQTATSSVSVVVTNPNAKPVANAGTPQTIVLPISTCTLSGSGTAGAGSITAYEWAQFSGTNASISSPTSASTAITGLTTAGSRVFRLRVVQTDGQADTAYVTVTVNAVESAKLIPGRIEAEDYDNSFGGLYTTSDGSGGTQVVGITIGAYMDYNVTVNTTGLYKVKFRIATAQNTAKFNILNGNNKLGTVNIHNTGDWTIWAYDSTNISLTAGVQTLRIISADPQSANFNWMDFVLVNNNITPVANAGSDQSVYYPPTSTTTLNGSGSFDPDGTIAAYSWVQISGSPVTVVSPTSQSTNLSGMTTGGIRTFSLTVTDNNGAVSTPDTISVTVIPNATPVANPGPAKTIVLPTTYTTLDGSGSSDDNAIVSYLWTQVSGIVAIITSPSSSVTTVTGMTQAGIRVFRLRVTDAQGLFAEADVTVTVNSSGKTGADFILKGIKGN